MTNVTKRIKEGVVKAMQYLENGDSVRRACQKSGISVTSLYHNTTPEQRELAYQKHVSPISGTVENRGPGRPRRKIRKRPGQISNLRDISALEQELKKANDYISKLEHKLVRTIVLRENVQ